jgi:hypothetical protein
MAPTLIRPDAVAIGENPLLISSARVASDKISFRHGGLYLRAARKRIPIAAGEGTTNLSAMIVEKMLGVIKVSNEIHRRLAALLAINCTPLLVQVSRDLHGLGKISRLPSRVWAGTAADYVTRGIGLEVMRRGGSVRRFDHGGTIGMTDCPEVTASLELLATTTHVLPTEKLAANVRSSGASKLLPSDQGLEIIGGDEEHPGSVPALAKSPASARRKVVYCPTLLLGFRRHAFATLPDPLSLDWTLRVAEALVEMPIDLLCKPHPEGILHGRAHPVEKIAATSYRPFEEEMAGADVFVFDRCHSTAFWAALCTDRPIVYLEATPPPFHPAVKEALERRCRILPATFDDRNRPQIDPEAFRDAVVGGETRVDPTEVQTILLGRAA